MKTYESLVNELKKIKDIGFVKTHRSGNTGIGKTLEDLLGIEENNIAGPDVEMIELKAARKGSPSMLTLFTKSPLPYGCNSVLLNEYGYPKPNTNKKHLHTTINAVSFNTLKGGKGLKAAICDDKIEILGPNNNAAKILGCNPYWDKESLQKQFEKKYPGGLLYVKADARGSGKNEEFHFNEAWIMHDFSFSNFTKLLQDGHLLIDIRIGQYSDGSPHDHGTGFRVKPDKLDLCFSIRKQVL
ncbi:MvaI/BcnI family restriction endonuclease [Candidatus Nitrosotenuis uzonensis]|uniref:MvaI/BcnI family restriction endonuclease n=1 Tax=Candidatus Nitrosotenuis uzonensis TaxID=1407055 RepID=UPI00196126A9|nr:MvaI/BcnI family restriction endonuclease [Candidatus Nitrosotenuis uzonensis]